MKIMQIISINGQKTHLTNLRIGDRQHKYLRAETHAFRKATICLCVLLMLFARVTSAQITWPADQLLPSFPPSASTQDLIYLQTNPPEERYLFSSLKGI